MARNANRAKRDKKWQKGVTSLSAEQVRGLAALKKFGVHALHRRTSSLFGDEFAMQMLMSDDCKPPVVIADPSDGAGGGGCFTPFGERLRLDQCRVYLPLSEIQSERMRSVGVMDSVESIASAMIDFYTGRIKVLEMRGATEKLLAKGEKLAKEYLSKTHPLLVVNNFAGLDGVQLANLLRLAALDIEKNHSKRQKSKHIHSRSFFPTVKPVNCQFFTTEFGQFKWYDNGNTLKQWQRIVYKCRDADAACTNAVVYECGKWEEVVVWQQPNGYVGKPPITPEKFQPYPWSNDCKILKNPKGIMVTGDYGWRNNDGDVNFHDGLDIGATKGAIVTAEQDGKIVHIKDQGNKGLTGLYVLSGGTISKYWHIVPDPKLKIDPKLGYLNIKKGTMLGTVSGDTVTSKGKPAIHLHFAKFNTSDYKKANDASSFSPCP